MLSPLRITINDRKVTLPLQYVLPVICLLVVIPVCLFIIKKNYHPPTPDQIATQKYYQAKEQAQVLSAMIANQTSVPTDETPNVATITDVTKLQKQNFFKQAQNGDKILIYEKKKLIVLYRPSSKKVIATAPVLFNQTNQTTSTASSATQSASPTLPENQPQVKLHL